MIGFYAILLSLFWLDNVGAFVTERPQRQSFCRRQYPWLHSDRNYQTRCCRAARQVMVKASSSPQEPKIHDDDNDERITDPKFLQRNTYWIVLVDDEESIRLAVGDYLYDEGYQVTACADAQALLEDVLPKAPNQRFPDVIVSDIRMPTKDGIQLLQEIRQNPLWSRLPVVLLTAKGLTTDRVAGYQAGADAYLTKPFDPEELLSILDNLILRRRQVKQATGGGLADLQQELATIKQLMEANAQNVVQATTVFLSDTERTVLDLVCQGYTNGEIATALSLSSTDKVSRTLTKLYRETKTKTRTELVRWAFATGYASASETMR